MLDLDETIKEFIIESQENLDKLDQDLITLEEEPTNSSVINQIFRIVHTIKGTCGFFEFRKLESVSHVGENLLDSLRDGSVATSNDVITALLKLGDALRKMLSSIAINGNEGEDDYKDLVETLARLNSSPKSTIGQCSTSNMPADKGPIVELIEIIDPASHSEGLTQNDSSAQDLEEAFLAAKSEQTANLAPHLPPEETAQTKENSPMPSSPATPSKNIEDSKVADTALRVDINLLDKLMNLVGELVLARNQILQCTKTQTDGEFVNTSQRLNLITSELQESVMRTRMQPISNVWNKFPRIVRDIALSCGKDVELEMSGKETELDKTIIEAIKDPLTHIIRNAVDHGIESPSIRGNAGKSPQGRLAMRAFHEGGQVIIEIADDGAGLNVEKIRNKAVEKGIVSNERVTRMNEQEILRLIFLPGFSTADKITNISGRGVGMDVVRSNIERIGGTVDVSSRLGRGTTFTIKIPLTLAIIPALVVTASANRFAIPQVNLLELVRIESESLVEAIEEVHGAKFYRLRGQLLPLIRLTDELKLENYHSENSALNIVVVSADNHQFGLIVDEIHDTEEIVVKPLGKVLKGVAAFAGATIMGDGRVALILDVVGLARSAKITKEEIIRQESLESHMVSINGQKRILLVFEVGNNQRAAIPLDEVHRLEEFELDEIEYAAGRMVVQYRNGILPLIDLQQALSGQKPEYSGSVKAFVHSCGSQNVGFIVANIIDIVEQAIKIEKPYESPGILGSAVVQDIVTDLIDISQIALKIGLNASNSTEQSWNNP